MSKIKVGIAMSGGVDSTSTAIMLKDKYNVSGFFMQLAQPDLSNQIAEVTHIADALDIPLQVIDLRDMFDTLVLDYFCNSYLLGKTPNPCIKCNREIKFGLFLDAILQTGVEKVATGHYARIFERDGKHSLHKGLDETKDQSYFLSRLSQEQLAKILFPLGELSKEEIYTFAEQNGFTNFRGKESQDVCFLQDSSVADFLRSRDLPTSSPGSIKDLSGNVLGSHKGIENYTIGQRRGLGISDSTPYYVVRLDTDTNSVIVGKNRDLLRKQIRIKNLHWISGKPPLTEIEYMVKIRYTHKGSPATLQQISDNEYHLLFSEEQRAVTPGQFCVIYKADEVIGSGEIV